MSVSKGRTNNYEAMFLVSQGNAADLNAITDHIKDIIGRANATIIAMKKWDERRLAFEINKQKRGVYFLVYFSCDPATIGSIERDCHLSERIMRVMVLRADHLTVEEMQSFDAQQQLADEANLRGSEEESGQSQEAPAEASA